METKSHHFADLIHDSLWHPLKVCIFRVSKQIQDSQSKKKKKFGQQNRRFEKSKTGIGMSVFGSGIGGSEWQTCLDLDKRRDEKAMIGVDSQRRRFELLLLVRAVLVDRVAFVWAEPLLFWDSERVKQKIKKPKTKTKC